MDPIHELNAADRQKRAGILRADTQLGFVFAFILAVGLLPAYIGHFELILESPLLVSTIPQGSLETPVGSSLKGASGNPSPLTDVLPEGYVEGSAGERSATVAKQQNKTEPPNLVLPLEGQKKSSPGATATPASRTIPTKLPQEITAKATAKAAGVGKDGAKAAPPQLHSPKAKNEAVDVKKAPVHPYYERYLERGYYFVRDGDTLLNISLRLYGDTDRAGAILDANRDQIENADQLKTGIRLRLPKPNQ